MKSRSARNMRWAALLAVVLVMGMISAVFAAGLALTPPGSIKQYSWDPSVGGGSPKWTNGNNPGYWEGETAAMAAEVTKEAGVTYDLPICLQVYEEPYPPRAYAFTGFEAFNTTTRAPVLPPVTLPGGEAINLGDGDWDLDHSFIYGYKLIINSVTPQVLGLPNCYANEVGVIISYTPQADRGAYIVWGGHVAKAGDPLPTAQTGAPAIDATVPTGMSAGYTIGNFHARLRTLAADKTLPFKVYFGPTAVTLQSLVAVPAALPVGGLAAFGALLGLAGVGIALRRTR